MDIVKLYKEWQNHLEEGELKYDKKIYEEGKRFISSVYIHYLTNHDKSPFKKPYRELLNDVAQMSQGQAEMIDVQYPFDVLKNYSREFLRDLEEDLEFFKLMYDNNGDPNLSMKDFFSDNYQSEYFKTQNDEMRQHHGVGAYAQRGPSLYMPYGNWLIETFIEPDLWYQAGDREFFEVLVITFHCRNNDTKETFEYELGYSLSKTPRFPESSMSTQQWFGLALKEIKNTVKDDLEEELMFGVFDKMGASYVVEAAIELTNFVDRTMEEYDLATGEIGQHYTRAEHYHEVFTSRDFNPIIDLDSPEVTNNKKIRQMLSRVNKILLFIYVSADHPDYSKDTDAAGYHSWKQYSHALREGMSTISIVLQKPTDNTSWGEFKKHLRGMFQTWRHELQHNSQRVIAALLNIDYKKAGRPNAYSNSWDSREGEWVEEHPLRGVEFKPRLSDEIERFISMVDRRSGTYFDPDGVGIIRLRSALNHTLDQGYFFNKLKNNKPGWYKKAVREFSAVVLDYIFKKINSLPKQDRRKLLKKWSQYQEKGMF